jgi:hypothetical protein
MTNFQIRLRRCTVYICIVQEFRNPLNSFNDFVHKFFTNMSYMHPWLASWMNSACMEGGALVPICGEEALISFVRCMTRAPHSAISFPCPRSVHSAVNLRAESPWPLVRSTGDKGGDDPVNDCLVRRTDGRRGGMKGGLGVGGGALHGHSIEAALCTIYCIFNQSSFQGLI